MSWLQSARPGKVEGHGDNLMGARSLSSTLESGSKQKEL